jgi:hypothetical protein
MTMDNKTLLMVPVLAAAGLLAGCATPPAPNSTAEVPYCHKTNKGRVIACTQAPAPSLNDDAEAKRLTPDQNALTVYVVRRNWGDGRQFVKVQADGGPPVETLPDTMVRMKLKPGRHSIAFEFDGRGQSTTVEGKAGDVRFVRIVDGMVWSWKSTFKWASEPEAATRERALMARLVAGVAMR